MRLLIAAIFLFSLSACISYRPIFAPNAKFQMVGTEVANQDADNCMKAADGALKESKKRRALKEGARGIGAGAIFGLIWGVFTGDADQIVKSAAVGAGIGGVVRGGSVLAEDKFTPDQIKQRYTSMCLNQKGYSILGWE